MTWLDFGNSSALERDVLRRALPAAASSGQTYARATYDTTSTAGHVSIGVADTLGFTPEACVDRLKLRPLLVGTAWKVLDLLLEEALAQAGIGHDRGAEYTIALKERLARTGACRPTQLTAATWQALTSTYAETVEIRHSLVHRSAHTNAAGDLIGVDRTGQPLRPLVIGEQEALARAALAAADVALTGTTDPRDEARLLRHLADLAGLHQQQLSGSPIPDVIPEVTIVVDPAPDDPTRYVLDMAAVRAWMPFQSAGDCSDLIVAPRDQPGQELRGRLEDAPAGVERIDPDAPPAWLH